MCRISWLQVAEMTEADFDTLWKQYMNALAVLLIEAGGDQDTAAGRRLARLVYEGGQLKGSMLVSYPDRIHYKLVRPLPETPGHGAVHAAYAAPARSCILYSDDVGMQFPPCRRAG